MTADDDLNQMGANNSPIQSGNYLSPQQRYQMNQYANTLMAPHQIKGIGSGLSSLGQAMVGGYLSNQANLGQSTRTPFWQGFGQNQPMQLNSANGGQDQASSIFSGLFGGTS